MPLTNIQKSRIQQTIANCLRSKFQNYEAKDNFYVCWAKTDLQSLLRIF